MGVDLIVFALLRKFCPTPSLAPGVEPLTAKERRICGRWYAGLALLMLPVIAIMVLIWFLCLRNAARVFYPNPPGTIRPIRGSNAVWLLPALYLGTVTAAKPMGQIVRAFLGERAARFRRFERQLAGYDAGRVFRWMSAIFLVGA